MDCKLLGIKLLMVGVLCCISGPVQGDFKNLEEVHVGLQASQVLAGDQAQEIGLVITDMAVFASEAQLKWLGRELRHKIIQDKEMLELLWARTLVLHQNRYARHIGRLNGKMPRQPGDRIAAFDNKWQAYKDFAVFNEIGSRAQIQGDLKFVRPYGDQIVLTDIWESLADVLKDPYLRWLHYYVELQEKVVRKKDLGIGIKKILSFDEFHFYQDFEALLVPLRRVATSGDDFY